MKNATTTIKDINAAIKEYKEYQRLAAELKEQMEALKKTAVEYMEAHGIDEYTDPETGIKVTYREVISNRFDSTAFKTDFLDIYKEYTKPSSSMRFTCN